MKILMSGLLFGGLFISGYTKLNPMAGLTDETSSITLRDNIIKSNIHVDYLNVSWVDSRDNEIYSLCIARGEKSDSCSIVSLNGAKIQSIIPEEEFLASTKSEKKKLIKKYVDSNNYIQDFYDKLYNLNLESVIWDQLACTYYSKIEVTAGKKIGLIYIKNASNRLKIINYYNTKYNINNIDDNWYWFLY